MRPLPVLYSFRRCPYAIRARLALAYGGIPVEIREVELKNKPQILLAISKKGTVPVLHLPDGTVIDESMDIIYWAMERSDLQGILSGNIKKAKELIGECDGGFKYWLDRYKYADRYPEQSAIYYREKAEIFIKQLDNLLSENKYLLREKETLADIAIMPFVRQFSRVDYKWFEKTAYQACRSWLNSWTERSVFERIMEKFSPWREGDTPIILNAYGDGNSSFMAAGGEQGIRSLVNDFYDAMNVITDAKKIRDMHPQDLEVTRDKLARFLCGWLGGPKLFREKYGQIQIPKAHAHLDIGIKERDAWLACMEVALKKQPYQESFKVYMLKELFTPADRSRTN